MHGCSLRDGSAAPAVKLGSHGIAKRYGPVVALEPAASKCAAGELLTLLGPSGSGKTTLLQVISRAGSSPMADGCASMGGTTADAARTSATSAWCSRTMHCSRT